MSDWPRYLAFRLASGLVGVLPPRAAARGGEISGRIAYRIDRTRRLMAQRHMRRVLGPTADIESAARSLFAAYGRYWAEVFWFRPHRTPGLLRGTRVDGLERALDIHGRGEGMILALPHMGNWELAGAEARRHGVEVVAVAEALTNRRIAKWFVSLRAKLGIEVILTNSRARVSRRLVEALEQGKAVALVADRNITGRGVEVEFFGEVTTMPAGPAVLALRAGVALLPVGTYFSDGGHRIIVDEPVSPPAPGPEAERISAMTQALAARFEALIRRAPTQWHLVQPNWPSDPR